jgi:hypothetical protein
VYAVLSERLPTDDDPSSSRRLVHNVTVCGGNRKRKSVVYVTSSNRVDIRLQVDVIGGDAPGSNAVANGADDGPQFLLRYEGQQGRVNSLVCFDHVSTTALDE